jgi:hypothetical protein
LKSFNVGRQGSRFPSHVAGKVAQRIAGWQWS